MAADLVNVQLVRLRADTHLFNANQKCWVLFRSGACATFVTGKHRGKGRYIQAWVQDKHISDFKTIAVSRSFADKHQLRCIGADA